MMSVTKIMHTKITKFTTTMLTKIIHEGKKRMKSYPLMLPTEGHVVEELSTDEQSNESTSVNEQSNSERHRLDEEVESTGNGRDGGVILLHDRKNHNPTATTMCNTFKLMLSQALCKVNHC